MVTSRAAIALCTGLYAAGCATVVSLGDPARLEPSDGGQDDGLATSTIQAVAVAVGSKHSCAVIGDDTPGSPLNGTIRCWGANDYGQLGSDPDMVQTSSTPRTVAGRSQPEQAGATAVALASNYSCTITDTGYLLCWGGVPTESGVVRQEETPPWEPSQMLLGTNPLGQVTSAAITITGGCCMQQDLPLLCWGPDVTTATDADGGTTRLDGGISVEDGVLSVAVGRAHACAIANTTSSLKDVLCWGANDRGQAGRPASDPVLTPAPLGLGSKGTIISVAAGGDDSCALFHDGTIVCWGAGANGQLGPSSPNTDSAAPVQVPIASQAKATAIAVGAQHSCALLEDTSVWCWGDDSVSQLGAGQATSYSPTPLRVQKQAGHNLSEVTKLAAGGQTTCVTLRNDRGVWCWGANDQGQAGQPGVAPVQYATRVPW
jgi:alpha-tubulin suppressor-like RCC1 family protein